MPTPDVSRMGSSMGMTDVGGSLGWKVRTYALPPLALPSLGAIGSPTVQSSGPNGSPSGRSCLLPLGLPSLGSILPFFHRDCGSFSTSPGRWSTEHQLLFLNFQPHFYFSLLYVNTFIFLPSFRANFPHPAPSLHLGLLSSLFTKGPRI